MSAVILGVPVTYEAVFEGRLQHFGGSGRERPEKQRGGGSMTPPPLGASFGSPGEGNQGRG